MKIHVTLKDPDGFSDSVREAVVEQLKELSLSESEVELLTETRCEQVWEKLKTWVEYQEYVNIEFDTDAGTATVVVRRG